MTAFSANKLEAALEHQRHLREQKLCVIELPEDAPDWALAHELRYQNSRPVPPMMVRSTVFEPLRLAGV